VIEPAPYEPRHRPRPAAFHGDRHDAAAGASAAACSIAYNIGYLIGVVPVLTEEGTVMWAAVSSFMSLTTLFFALALVDDTERRLELLLKGYLAVAIAVSIFGILTYFHPLPGSDTFIFASRSRSTFKDPNVLGAFLVLPTVLALQRTMTGRLRDFLIGGLMTAVLAIELLLAFSRGAWGAFAPPPR
jgi:hypothetical protein